MKRLAVVQCLPRERKVRNVKCSVVWWSLNKSSWSERGLRDPTVYSSRPILLFHSMPVTGVMYRRYVMHCCRVPSCILDCVARQLAPLELQFTCHHFSSAQLITQTSASHFPFWNVQSQCRTLFGALRAKIISNNSVLHTYIFE